MATCAEDVSELGNMIPVRACPVIMNNEDDENTKQLKRSELCVPCKEPKTTFQGGKVFPADFSRFR